MPRITIDNREVEVEPGSTILDAAETLGLEIPTLCFLKGRRPCTSCFVCVVKVNGRENLLPACATRAEEGMRVQSETPEVHQARRMALELLLSDHLGDCEGPCHRVCPAHMNIPLMIRRIAAGDLRSAVATVKADIALPAVLGRICPAPCERACRRAAADKSLSIMLLKRYVADADLASAAPYLPARKAASGRKVAIIGAGPTGLAAAYYLLQEGHACTLFDEHDAPGGMLRYAVPEERLPRDVLDAEIAVIARLGAEFRLRTRIGTDLSLEQLRKDFGAVVVAVGKQQAGAADVLGLPAADKGITVDGRSLQTAVAGVFAGGDAVRPQRLTVRAVADGKAMAASIAEYLAGRPVAGPRRSFNIHIGHLREGEMAKFMAGASAEARLSPSGDGGGFRDDEARRESLRCLHCDCRKPDECKLRRHAGVHDAKGARYKEERRTFEQRGDHPDIIYEPGKCIDCGLCVQIASDAGEELGLTFIGRGFSVRVAVPFASGMAEGLKKVAVECARACPTGALVLKGT
jgi:ferredoxin